MGAATTPVPIEEPASSRPTGATVLGAAGGVLIALQSLYLAVYGNYLTPFGWSGLSISGNALGGVGLLESTAIVALSVLLYAMPYRHAMIGVGMVTFALLSLASGGGFVIGAFLAWVAGVMGVMLFPAPRRQPSPESIREAADDPVAEADVLDTLRPA